MKTVRLVLLALAVLLLPRYAQALDLGSVRISFLEGDVQMRTTESGDWIPAAVNTPLDEGDELWVPEGGRMEFQFNTGDLGETGPEFSAADTDPGEGFFLVLSLRGTYVCGLQCTARQRHPVRHSSIIPTRL